MVGAQTAEPRRKVIHTRATQNVQVYQLYDGNGPYTGGRWTLPMLTFLTFPGVKRVFSRSETTQKVGFPTGFQRGSVIVALLRCLFSERESRVFSIPGLFPGLHSSQQDSLFLTPLQHPGCGPRNPPVLHILAHSGLKTEENLPHSATIGWTEG